VDLRPRCATRTPMRTRGCAPRLSTPWTIKPEKHHFDLDGEPQILRFMNATGG
jgi:hypothetical protein